MLKQASNLNKNYHKLGLVNSVLLSMIPIATGCAIASAPAQAATLAYSTADFLLNNFTHNPTGSTTQANVSPFSTAGPGSSVDISAEAFSIFINQNQSPLAYNTTLTMGIGQGDNYFGKADSMAKVVGNFFVGKNESFGFDFFGNLDLKTSIDDRMIESAYATGNIHFMVLDTTNSQEINVLDHFLLSGGLITPGPGDYLFAKKSKRVTLNNFSKEKDFVGKEESAVGSVAGSYKRSFKKATNLTVIEVKENNTIQEAKSECCSLNTTAKSTTTVSPIVTEMGSETSEIDATTAKSTTTVSPIVAAMGSETSEIDSTTPTLPQNVIVSAIGNESPDLQGSYDSSKMTLGDMKTAIANSDKAKTWLKGKTKYTPLLPDAVVKELQLFSDVSSGAWVDPPTTYGLEYTVEGDSLITNILDFFTDDTDDLFTIAAEGKILGEFSSGDNINFVSLLGKGVSNFTITGVTPSAGNAVANFNFRPLFNTAKADLSARSFDKDGKTIPEPGFAFSLVAFGVLGLASRLFSKR